jgi:hypothetical protein
VQGTGIREQRTVVAVPGWESEMKDLAKDIAIQSLKTIAKWQKSIQFVSMNATTGRKQGAWFVFPAPCSLIPIP